MKTDADIARAVLDQITSQSDLLTTLSLGICGGLLFLMMQVMLHNGKEAQKIRFRWPALLVACFLTEGASIASGVFSRAAITAITPTVFSLDFSRIGNWTDAQFPGHDFLRVTAGMQFILFFLAIIELCVFILANHENMKGFFNDEQ